jgi:adenylate cyclase class IV
MPTNIEIKARVADRDSFIAKAQNLAGSELSNIDQDDTFFRCEAGRLKLRTLGENDGQLIFYQRSNQAGPRASFFTATPTTDPTGLRTALTLAYGAVGRVRKHRILFIAGRTRIHLDRVDQLGDFVELEVTMAEHDDRAQATEEAESVMAALGIRSDQLVPTAYVDLIAATQ